MRGRTHVDLGVPPKKGRPPKKAPAPPSHQTSLFEGDTFIFGPRFLEDHAGHILTDPRTAVVELIANTYDAGASRVRVRWPESDRLMPSRSRTDRTRMTRDELLRRWRTLSYNRLQEQGAMAEPASWLDGPRRPGRFRAGLGKGGTARSVSRELHGRTVKATSHASRWLRRRRQAAVHVDVGAGPGTSHGRASGHQAVDGAGR